MIDPGGHSIAAVVSSIIQFLPANHSLGKGISQLFAKILFFLKFFKIIFHSMIAAPAKTFIALYYRVNYLKTNLLKRFSLIFSIPFSIPGPGCAALCFVPFLFSACAPVIKHYPLIDSYLAQQQFIEADRLIIKNKAKYGKRNSVLYNLDRGMILHLAGQFAKSNIFLTKAQNQIEKLYTKSIIAETGALLINDNTLSYKGEDFERVMINVISALNYIYLNQWDEAQVEARKVDHKLNLINDKYEKKNVFKEDAFARYLTGIIYEAKGELNDAFIAYRKAYETYQNYARDYGTSMLPTLPGDLLRVTETLGLIEEHKMYREKFPKTTWITQKEFEKLGEIIIFSFDGRSPVKEDYFITVPVPDGKNHTNFIRLALPQFVEQPTNLAFTKVYLKDSGGRLVTSQETFLVEDITAIAIKNLEDRIGRITAKTIARASAKFIIGNEIRKKAKDDPLALFLAGIGTNIYSFVSEKADKRSWRTLPGQIRMARLKAPPDSYTIKIEYYSWNKRLLKQKTYDVTVRAGEKKFLSHRFLGTKIT